MKRTAATVALATLVLAASTASAQTNDHFARQRQEAVARQAVAQQHFSHTRGGSSAHVDVSRHGSGHWGGTTTTHRYYQPAQGHFHQQNIQFYPVSPYGYGVPSYGFYGGVSPYNCSPYYGISSGSGIYIHREIYHSR
jgi:hypothetical protein